MNDSTFRPKKKKNLFQKKKKNYVGELTDKIQIPSMTCNRILRVKKKKKIGNFLEIFFFFTWDLGNQ